MNQKLFSVIFSVLLCSTFGHEYLNAHKHTERHHERGHIDWRKLNPNPNECSYLCPVPAPTLGPPPRPPMHLVFLEESGVFALINATVEVAIAFQIGEPIALLADAKIGEAIVINIRSQTVVHYPVGSNGIPWKNSKTPLLDLLQNLGSFDNLKNWKNGQTFKFDAVTNKVNDAIISIVKHLDPHGIAPRVKKNPNSVVSLVSVLTNNLLDSSDILPLVLGKLKSSVNVIYGGLNEVVNLMVGLKAIGKKLQGGLSSIIKDDTNISLLLGEESGLTSLINLLLQSSEQVDLTKILGKLLNPEDIFGLAVQLDRGKTFGLRGITSVLYNIQLYAAKKISLEALIDILIQVEATNGLVKVTKEMWNEVLNWYFLLAKTQTSRFNTDSSWSTLNKFFQDIKDETLIIKGINVSAIINILIATSGNVSLSNVVKILVELKPVVALSKVIATLYFRLIWFVISGHGIFYINELLPDVAINVDYASATSIIKQLFSKVNVLEIVAYLVRLDIVGAITNLPVLGAISKALDDTIKSLGIVEVTVGSSLKAVGYILEELKQLILFGLGRGGKAPSNSGIAGLSILGGGISISIKTNWVSSEEWSSSNGGSAGPSGTSSGSQGGSSEGSSGGSSSGASGGSSSGASGGSSSGASGGSSSGASGGGSSGASGGSSSGASGGSSSGGSGSGNSGGSGSLGSFWTLFGGG